MFGLVTGAPCRVYQKNAMWLGRRVLGIERAHDANVETDEKKGGPKGGQRITPMGVAVTMDVHLLNAETVKPIRQLTEQLKKTGPKREEFEQGLKKKIKDGQDGKAARKFSISVPESLTSKPYVREVRSAKEATRRAQRANIHYGRRKFIKGLAKDNDWAARQIQGWWRKHLAAVAVQAELHNVWTKLWDDDALEWYYYNERTGESSWDKPHMLKEGDDIETGEGTTGDWGKILKWSEDPDIVAAGF